jgi:hypothetical protein
MGNLVEEAVGFEFFDKLGKVSYSHSIQLFAGIGHVRQGCTCRWYKQSSLFVSEVIVGTLRKSQNT